MINRDTSSRDDEITQYVCLNSHKVLAKNSTRETNNTHVSLALKAGSILLDKYKIVKLLKCSQFGFVYLAEKNDASKKLFVIKEFFPKDCVARGNRGQMLIKSSLNTDKLLSFNFMRKIFKGEAENLAKISRSKHTNIINLTELEENKNNTIYMVIPYEEGVSLKEYLEKRKEKGERQLNNDEIYQIVNPLLDALEHIHKLGVHHLDVKPENILIKKDGSPLLLGFKASTIFYDDDSREYCNAYTPAYASPEQIVVENASQVDQSSDIYSMGVLLYNLITDTFPPKADERIESIVANRNDDPYISLLGQELPGEYTTSLLGAVDKALSFSKKNRYRSANDFKNAIFGIKLSAKPKVKKERKIAFYLVGLMIPLFILFIYFGWESVDNKPAPQVVHKSDVVEKNDSQMVSSEDKKSDNELYKIDDANRRSVKVTEQQKVDLQQMASEVKQEKPKAKESHTKDQETDKIMASVNPDTISQMKKTNEDQSLLDNTDQAALKAKQQAPVMEPINEVNVQIDIKLPISIGETRIKVNGKELVDGNMVAHRGSAYQISIENPYCRTVNVKRTFDELLEFPKQTFIPVLGRGKVYLGGLPSNVKIKVYQLVEDKIKEVVPKIDYRNEMYEMILQSGKKFYMTFDKNEYKHYKTKTLILQHGKALTQTYSLEKKDSVKEQESVSALTSTENNNIEKKQVDTVVEKTKQETDTKERSKKNNIEPMIIQPVIKEVVPESPKPVVEEVVVVPPKKIKKKTVEKKKPGIQKKPDKTKQRKKPSKRDASDLVWYCDAKAMGTAKMSAKHTDKQTAKRAAMQRCIRANKGRGECRILNCFLLRN